MSTPTGAPAIASSSRGADDAASAPAGVPLLVELVTEELPPKALRALSDAFAAGIARGLAQRKLAGDAARALAYGSPRRLAVLVPEVAAVAPDEPIEQKLMPASVALGADGTPTAALRKKLASLGRDALAGRVQAHAASLAATDDTVIATDGADTLLLQGAGKSRSLHLRSVARGAPLAVGLQAALDEAIAALPIPKVMSYQLADGETTVEFIRPAHRLVALHGAHVVPVRALGLEAGRTTLGHRFMSAGEIVVRDASSWAGQLEREGKVIASFQARRDRVRSLVDEAAAAQHATPIRPDELLDEVCALVEWPSVYDSSFEREFLEVPEECLILTMQQNQKYFALRDPDGRLSNRFLLVSNLQADDPSAIRHGNARVVRARLADAKFFYDQDRRQALETRIPGLAHVVYHNKLGSQLERVERLTGIAVALARLLDADVTHVERAARLAKADLRTLMVGEFPELQGIMGEYYARHDGESPDVARAIREHYQPRYAGDALPATRIGQCVALADKLETLVGMFGIGQVPTGDKDPFALRRHTLGVLRIVIEGALPVTLDALIDAALAEFGREPGAPWPEHARQLREFVWDRLRGWLREQGYTAHEIAAVVDDGPQSLALVPQRLAAVRAFSALPESSALAEANKRIVNILRKAGDPPVVPLDASLFDAGAERELATLIDALAPEVDARMSSDDFTGALALVARARDAVDRFFDDVMVMADDARVRNNRLALLGRLRGLMNRVADISKLSAA